MSKKIDLKQIERNAFRAAFQDGLTDVLLGSVFATLSLVPWLEQLGLPRPFGYLIVFAILFVVWAEIKLFKNRFVAPRLGIAVFGQARKNRMKQARLALIVMVLVTVGLVAFTATGILQKSLGTFSEWGSYLFIGAIFVVTLSLLAFFLDYPRLYVYGWLLSLLYPFSVWLENRTGWLFPSGETFFGGIIIVVGLITYIQFLRQHPLPPSETAV